MLRQTSGIRSVHLLTPSETSRLLESWLGSPVPLEELPVPRLIDVGLDPAATIDMPKLGTQLGAVVPEIRIDDYRPSVGGLRARAWPVRALLGAVIGGALLLVAASAAFATGAALAARRSDIELLHLLGADDRQITQPYTARSLVRALIGCGIAAAATLATVAALGGALPLIRLAAPAGGNRSGRLAALDCSRGDNHRRRHPCRGERADNRASAPRAPAVARTCARLASVFRRAGWLAGAVLLLWLGGFVWFVGSSLWVRVDRASPTDAIVVLTGGKMRLETGLELLEAGKAGKLFVSGVNPAVDRDTLLRALGPAATREACCIVLGHTADNTVGNALETAVWMQQEGYRSLRLVTSWYHMHRSLLEFGRAMPRVRVVAHPVFARDGEPEGWRGRLTAGQTRLRGISTSFSRPGCCIWLRATPKAPATPVIRTMAPATGENAWPRHL